MPWQKTFLAHPPLYLPFRVAAVVVSINIGCGVAAPSFYYQSYFIAGAMAMFCSSL
jgi:hypothetical protein